MKKQNLKIQKTTVANLTKRDMNEILGMCGYSDFCTGWECSKQRFKAGDVTNPTPVFPKIKI